MKILHIISSLETGGAQRLLSDILPLMVKGNAVTLLVNKDIDNDFSKKVREAGVKIVSMQCPNPYHLKNIFLLMKMMKGYDIVHVHLFPSLYWAALASLFTRVNLVYTEHSTSNRRRGKWYFRPIESFAYNRYKRVISISEQARDALVAWVGASSTDKRYVVVNNGVNLAHFSGNPTKNSSSKTLIMVSRFVASKDQMTVLRAMRLLPDDVHLILVGDGENLAACKTFAEKQGLSDRVQFVGNQSDVNAWIAKADVGIQSSKWEGFGLTAVELMAAGKPVVATDVEGLRQVVEGAGLLFPVGDEERLATMVKRLLDDESYYKQIAGKCSERAKLYDIHVTVDQYLEIYNEIIGG